MSLPLMWALVALVFLGLPALTMGLARLFGARQWWMLLVAALLGGAIPGGFVASSAAAMSTAAHPTAALLRGIAIGGVLGLASGVLVLACAWAWQRVATGRAARRKTAAADR